MIKIVVDIYGADDGTQVVINGIAKALNSGMEFFPVMVGDKDHITELMQKNGITDDRYEIVNTDKFISASDPASCIFGGCDDSSMVMGYARLKDDDECCAMLSPGNTGALLVGSICRLGLIEGLKFPALACHMPCCLGKTICLVDCGSNTDCTAADLERYAKMGDIFCKCYCKIENPRVGLMSVGREKQKGSKLIYEAYERIEKLPLNFVGNIEGSDMVTGYADVIVSDGFSGNVLIKCVESVGKAAADMLSDFSGQVDADTLKRMQQALLKRFDMNSQGAATFLGPKKTVVKMHGCANEDTTVSAIQLIVDLENSKLRERLSTAFVK